MNNEFDQTPWYKQILVWMLIMPPLAAVIGGIVTISLAIESDDGLVVDDYYKQGLGINKTLQRDQLAVEIGVTASLHYAADHATLVLKLDKAMAVSDDTLRLSYIHPTLDNRDLDIELSKVSQGTYRAILPQPLTGIWNLLLEPADKRWRVTGRAVLPTMDAIRLTPEV